MASPAAGELSELDAEADDGGALLRVRCLDAGSGEPISDFRVISGVEIRILVEPSFAERHPGEEIVVWQPHTAAASVAGVWDKPLARAYNPLALRVEADGYVPDRHLWVDKGKGSQELVFELKKDARRKGRVLLADGTPAAGAQVGVALVQRNVRLEEGGALEGFGEPMPAKLGDAWRRPTMVAADAGGRFELPGETDPAAAVVVAHESGVASLFYADFAADPEIELEPWGRIEGEVALGEKPGEGIEVTFGIQHYGFGYPDMFRQGGVVETDASGKFAFEKVVPGTVQVSLFQFFPQDGGGRGFRVPTPESAYTHVVVEPGETAKVKLGGPELLRPVAKPLPQLRP